ncbi:uncharacterized protein LOC129981629 [Argiope bruennichi]|uniref:uncharacterized protein LOC129981629 n=1 Tax=Argiope bruennichi TaxID=94029 RepID=UPI0024954E50|nr:uncharacterized protein LOC129981629 [Argiope bruennichi]XP_055948520.1 uncharacterized protein LOC129981629 [Argiope bruennichi]XP_055948522.1 uncharacterized protein LOC129981629 [Argiope bruennichi]
MNFHFMPSLLHIASVKIASHLLLDPDVRIMLDNEVTMMHPFHLFQSSRLALWGFIEKTAMEKLPLLPPSIPPKVAKMIQPMHYEVVMWLEDHVFIFPGEEDFCSEFLNYICWKSNGTIDRVKTAKKIIHSDRIDISDRFKLACNYFFLDEIVNLWHKMKANGMVHINERQTNTAVRFWIKLMKEGGTKTLEELIAHYFRPAFLRYLDIPLRISSYFRFLSKQCRRDYLLNNNYLIHKDDFRQCLYQMDEAERLELFHANPATALKQALMWPFQSLFIKLANELLKYMQLADFITIFDHILIYYIMDGYDYYDHFRELWLIVPESYKIEINRDERRRNAFRKIMQAEKNAHVAEYVFRVIEGSDYP